MKPMNRVKKKQRPHPFVKVAAASGETFPAARIRRAIRRRAAVRQTVSSEVLRTGVIRRRDDLDQFSGHAALVSMPLRREDRPIAPELPRGHVRPGPSASWALSRPNLTPILNRRPAISQARYRSRSASFTSAEES